MGRWSLIVGVGMRSSGMHAPQGCEASDQAKSNEDYLRQEVRSFHDCDRARGMPTDGACGRACNLSAEGSANRVRGTSRVTHLISFWTRSTADAVPHCLKFIIELAACSSRMPLLQSCRLCRSRHRPLRRMLPSGVVQSAHEICVAAGCQARPLARRSLPARGAR